MIKQLAIAHCRRSLSQEQRALLWKAMKGEKAEVPAELTSKELDKLVSQLFPIADDATQTVKNHAMERRSLFQTALKTDDLQNFRNTKWQFVNAAADMADHAQPVRMTATSRENRLSNVFAGHPLLDRAYELAYAM